MSGQTTRTDARDGQSKPINRWTPGVAPTGSELTSEGSSVETDSDVATAQDIPETEEILARAERVRQGEDLPYMHAAGPHAPSGGVAGGARTLEEVEAEPEEERRPKPMEEEGAWIDG